MKLALKPQHLPVFSLCAGAIGFALYTWLFTTGTDEKGLLVTAHPAGTLLFLLSAVTLAVLFLSLRSLPPISKYTRLFPASVLSAIGCVLGAATLLYTSISEVPSATDIFNCLLLPMGIVAAIALLYIAYCRYRGFRPQFFLTCAPMVYMMFQLVCLCRLWGTEPQLLQYFFPLMACVFLLLTCYQRSALVLSCGSHRQFLIFNQAALFFCCLSAATPMRIFFLGMAIWMVADSCVMHPHAFTKEV